MHDDELRIEIPVRMARSHVLVSDEVRAFVELRVPARERMTREAMERLSPYDVARWFDVPPHWLTYPELTEGER